MTQPEALRQLLTAIALQQISPEVAFEKLKYLEFEPVEEYAKVDHHRSLRTGFPEVIRGPGKTVEQVVGIMRATWLSRFAGRCPRRCILMLPASVPWCR